jgi:hypothetical protein
VRTFRAAALAVLLSAIVAGAWATIVPSRFGGTVDYVSVGGSSMAPALHDGDLVLVRSVAAPKVGQVAAYRMPGTGQLVLHRIVATDGGRLTLKGDANSWVDSTRPRASEVRVAWHMVAGFGADLEWAKRHGAVPTTSLLLLGNVALDVRRRRRRRPADPRRKAPRHLRPPTLAHAQLVAPLLGTMSMVLVLALGFAAYAWTRTATPSTDRPVAVAQRGELRYASPRSATGQAISTGDPILIATTPVLDISFTYRVSAPDLSDVTGSTSLHTVVLAADGWHDVSTISDPTGFRGSPAIVRGQVRPAELQQSLRRWEAARGAVGGEAAVAIVATTRSTASIAGQHLQQDLRATYQFRLLPNGELVTSPAPTIDETLPPIDGAREPGLVVTRRSAKQISTRSDATVWAWWWRPTVQTTRTAASAVALLAGTVLAVLGRRLWRRNRDDELARIVLLHGDRLVEVAEPIVHDDAIELASFADVLRLADEGQEPILWFQHGATGEFFVEHDDEVFRYTTEPVGSHP